jgi:hypothetical protein
MTSRCLRSAGVTNASVQIRAAKYRVDALLQRLARWHRHGFAAPNVGAVTIGSARDTDAFIQRGIAARVGIV